MRLKRLFSTKPPGKAIVDMITGARPGASVHVSLECVDGESGGVSAPIRLLKNKTVILEISCEYHFSGKFVFI